MTEPNTLRCSPRPLQNRVHPDGRIMAVPARGLLMGNRGGQLHDTRQRLGRARWRSSVWIACRLAFKNRQRAVMGAGYTELFFLDEATALAAGHRPCYECRRADAERFAALWAEAFSLADPPRAGEIDAALHPVRRLHPPLRETQGLPDGTMVATELGPALLWGAQAYPWSFFGYAPPHARPSMAHVLTPGPIVAVLAAGYRPMLHPSQSSEG